MMLPDVNVLVYAFRRENPDHGRYANWLTDSIASGDLGVSDFVLSSFVRIVTNPASSRIPIR